MQVAHLGSWQNVPGKEDVDELASTRKIALRIALVFVSAIAIALGLYSVIRNSRTLATAEQQIVDLDRDLRQANQEVAQRVTDLNKLVADTIPDAISGHTRLLTTLARQYRPGAEWSSSVVNAQSLQLLYERTFSDFVNNPRHREDFPKLVASASYRLGQLQFLSGNPDDARRSLGEAIALATSVNDPSTAGLAGNTRGCVHAAFGDYNAAIDDFHQSLRRLSAIRDHQVPTALALRNIGLIERAMGTDGLPSLRRAVELLSNAAPEVKFSYTNELLIDARMALCEMYWARGEIGPAREQCELAHQSLVTQLELTRDFGKPSTARNRYINASFLAEQNLAKLVSLSDNGPAASTPQGDSPLFSAGWQWQPLFDLTTELVSTDLSVTATMTAEFDPQNGLLIGWGMYDWTKQLVVEIAKRSWDRCSLVIIADNDESLREARNSLHEAGIPLSEIHFRICAHDTSWFRDGGPITGKAPSGDAVWFDAMLTRHDLPKRAATDSLPSLVSNDWQTRVARTSIHIEGGMLLSNGRGLTVGTRPLLEINRRYGFDDDFIVRELERVTGAKKLVLVDAMIDEPTGHLDMFMTFVDHQTVVVGQFVDPSEPNAQLLDRIAETLSNTEFDGKPLKVVRIPMPARRKGLFAQRNTGIFQSFTNVVYLNGMLFIPTYEGEAAKYEQSVQETYAGLLPDWEIQFIDCSRVSLFSGALHCLVSNLGDTPYLRTPEY